MARKLKLKTNELNEIVKELKELNSIPSWSKNKKTKWELLCKKLEFYRHIVFSGHFTTYQIGRIGEFKIIEVNNRMQLYEISKNRALVVCIGQGSFNARFFIGVSLRV